MANGMEGVSLFVWLWHVHECYIHINASHCPQIDVSFVCAHNCCLNYRGGEEKIKFTSWFARYLCFYFTTKH